MTTFDEREKAFENKYFHDEEMKFKIISRRRKLLGLWCAEQMHMSDEDALAYALDIVRFGIEDTRDGAVINKLLGDITEHGFSIEEQQLRLKMAEFHEEAERQIKSE